MKIVPTLYGMEKVQVQPESQERKALQDQSEQANSLAIARKPSTLL